MTHFDPTRSRPVRPATDAVLDSSPAWLAAMPMAAVLCDVHGGVIDWNAAASELCGGNLLVGMRGEQLFASVSAASTGDDSPLTLALRSAAPVAHASCSLRSGQAGTIPVVASFAPVNGRQGAMVGLLCSFQPRDESGRGDTIDHDATVRHLLASDEQPADNAAGELDRRIDEGRLPNAEIAQNPLSSERNFSLLVGSVTDYAIFMLDPQGNVSNWNAGAERIKGYTASEVVGQHFSRFYTPEDRAAGMPQRALATAQGAGRFEAEGWRMRKDGTRFWANVVIDPIHDKGQLIGFAKITRDITERRTATLALAESEYRARGVIDTALDGFVQIDQDDKVLEWNPRAEAMFGWSRAQALGQSLDELIIAPTNRARCHDALLPTLQQHLPHGQLRQIEAQRKDGSSIMVELSVSTLSLSSGQLRNIFAHDLTDKLLTEAKLRQAQKMDAVGQLTGGIAHDFNNLLQGIIGSLDLIQLRLEQQRTDNLGRFIDGAMTSAKRAAGLIHRLLAFSRRQPLDPKAVQANPRIASMEELLRRTIGEQITLEMVLAPDLWTTLCDPNQLESALLNLAINARDAMPDGGQLTVCSSNVEIDTTDDHGAPDRRSQFICIEVGDTGTGMDADMVEHAFDPFFTTKPTGQGTGLGLSMVYGFARQSNGHCEIHSKPGRGTCVRLYLPRLLDAEFTPEEAPPRPIHTQPDGRGETVLVVEDDQVVRNIVVEVLGQLGYRTLEAADGSAGLELLLSDTPIDLLVSDIGLPGLNGRQMADGARAKRPDLKVLLMTGYASNAAEPGGFLGPGMELITKPFATPALVERVQRMLRSQ